MTEDTERVTAIDSTSDTIEVGDYIVIKLDATPENAISEQLQTQQAVGRVEDTWGLETGTTMMGVEFQGKISIVYRHFLDYELELVDLRTLSSDKPATGHRPPTEGSTSDAGYDALVAANRHLAAAYDALVETNRRLAGRVGELEAALTPFADAWENNTLHSRGLRAYHPLCFGENAVQLHIDEQFHQLRGTHLLNAYEALKGQSE